MTFSRIFGAAIAIFALLTNSYSESSSIANLSQDRVNGILQDRSETVRAAHDFAAVLNNSDESKNIQSFAAAYKLAQSAQQAGISSVVTPTVANKPTQWQKAALADQTFQRNFVKTVDATINGAAIVGEPVPVEWRILNGQTTDAFTDCVAVGCDYHFFCSGTIIGKRIVLTAGHCVKDCDKKESKHRQYMIRVGPTINEGPIIKVSKIIPHPDLNLGRHPFNDLALLILEEAVPDDATVRTIATEEQLFNSYQITVVGFGTDMQNGNPQGFGVKRSADVPIVTYDGSVSEGKKPFGCDIDLEFAASSLEIFRPLTPMPKGGAAKVGALKDTCNGDSGGPAYVRGPGDAWVLAGTTSRPIANAAEYVSPGERPTKCGDGGIYVRVDKYWPTWIASIVSGESLNSP